MVLRLMYRRDDAAYYAELEAGATYLAETTADPSERKLHLSAARIYRARAKDASAWLGPGAIH
jgi:hypothetical protein